MERRIKYARTEDGVDIAYAVAGQGPLLLAARPLLRPAVDDDMAFDMDPAHARLAQTRSVVIWDHRGLGLSSAAEPILSLDSTVLDLKAVADALTAPSFDVLAELIPCQTALAFAARYPERIRRVALRNPSRPGQSPRSTALVGLPEIEETHFAEYAQLAALRIFGWDRAPAAKRFAETLTSRFDGGSWLRYMASMEAVDASAEAQAVVAPVLVMIDPNVFASKTAVDADTQRWARGLAASIKNAELAVFKEGDTSYDKVVEKFLSGGTQAEATPGGSGTAIILFADIVDSTALTERIGDAAFRERARALDASMRSIITGAGGTAIDGKLLGDGVLATFPAASQAIDAALRCGAAGDEQALPLHLGLHAGDVIREQNNVFGGAVNIASRISGLSAPGEVLVSRTVADLARTSAGVTFEDRGEHALKGVGDPQRVYAVRREGV